MLKNLIKMAKKSDSYTIIILFIIVVFLLEILLKSNL